MRAFWMWLPAGLALALGAGLVAFGGSPLPALVGLPLVAAGLAWALSPPPPALAAAGRRLAASPVASWGLPLAALAALTCLAYAPLLEGAMPWAEGQSDHPTHLYQAWLLVDRMIPSGRLTGWSDLRWAGYPALELYPIGGSLWVALFRLLTFGAMSWEATYALAILGMLVLNVMAVYVTTRRFIGPFAAIVAALIVLFERGWPRQGGDHYAVDVGVWPITLGVAPSLLCIERLWTWVNGRRGSRSGIALAGAAFFAAFALLCHPFYLPVLALALPTLAAVAALSGARGSRAATGPVLVAGVGFGLVAFWYLPMVAGSRLTEPGGAPFRSLGNLGEGLIMGSMLPSFWPVAAVLGLVGLLVALRRGRAPAMLASLALVLVLAASSTPLELSGRLADMTSSLQQERFFILVRVLTAILAAYAASVLASAARQGAPPARSPIERRARAALAVGLLAPLAWPCAEGLLKHQVSPIVALEAGPDLSHRRDLLALCRWMQGAALGESPPPRTAWHVGYGRHEHTSAPVFCGLAQVVDTPAETWATRPGGISEREVRALGIRWVVGDRPIEGRESYLAPVRRFGGLHVYEVRDFSYRRVTSLGSAAVTLERFEDELIRVRVRGARRGDRVAVHVSRHPNWQASYDGRPVPIGRGHLGLPRAEFIHVRAEDGVLELRYVRGEPHRNGALLSLLAAMLLAVLGMSGLLAPALASTSAATWVRTTASRLPRPARIALGAVLPALVLLGPLALGGRSRPGTEERAPVRAVGELLVDRLDAATVRSIVAGQGVDVGRRWDGRFGEILPPRVLVDRHVEALDLGDPRRVIAVRTGEGEAVRLRFAVGPVRGVRGYVARGGRGREATRLEVRVGRRSVGTAVAPELGRWAEVALSADRPGEPLELVVTGEGASGRAALLDLAIVR